MYEGNVEKVRQYFLKRLKVCDTVRATDEQIAKDIGMSVRDTRRCLSLILNRREIAKEYSKKCTRCMDTIGFYDKLIDASQIFNCGECGENGLEIYITYKAVKEKPVGADLEEAMNEHLAQRLRGEGMKVAGLYRSACCKAEIFTEADTPSMCRFICRGCNKPCRGLRVCTQCKGQGDVPEWNHFGSIERIECSRCKGDGLQQDEAGCVGPRKSV